MFLGRYRESNWEHMYMASVSGPTVPRMIEHKSWKIGQCVHFVAVAENEHNFIYLFYCWKNLFLYKKLSNTEKSLLPWFQILIGHLVCYATIK